MSPWRHNRRQRENAIQLLFAGKYQKLSSERREFHLEAADEVAPEVGSERTEHEKVAGEKRPVQALAASRPDKRLAAFPATQKSAAEDDGPYHSGEHPFAERYKRAVLFIPWGEAASSKDSKIPVGNRLNFHLN